MKIDQCLILILKLINVNKSENDTFHFFFLKCKKNFFIRYLIMRIMNIDTLSSKHLMKLY